MVSFQQIIALLPLHLHVSKPPGDHALQEGRKIKQLEGALLTDISLHLTAVHPNASSHVQSDTLAGFAQDRVEVSPEQLAESAAAAEDLSEQSGTHVQIIGWYHSHPHITVFPRSAPN